MKTIFRLLLFTGALLALAGCTIYQTPYGYSTIPYYYGTAVVPASTVGPAVIYSPPAPWIRPPVYYEPKVYHLPAPNASGPCYAGRCFGW